MAEQPALLLHGLLLPQSQGMEQRKQNSAQEEYLSILARSPFRITGGTEQKNHNNTHKEYFIPFWPDHLFRMVQLLTETLLPQHHIPHWKGKASNQVIAQQMKMAVPGSSTFITLRFWKLLIVFYKQSSANSKYLKADR